MNDKLPDHAFSKTNVVHKVRDTVRRTLVKADEDEVAGAKPYRASYDVSVSNMVDDPMVAVMLLSHLRKMLGGPDIKRITVEVDYEFDGLSREQLQTLFALEDTSWSMIHVEVNTETRFYERNDGKPPLKRDEAA